jgi:TonB-linked SusC/RagA family outer membrane protein
MKIFYLLRKYSLLTVVTWLLTFSVTYAQSTVTGTVTDENGKPLPGVTVKVKQNSSTNVATDLNGHFSIKLNDANDILIFRFVGYTTQEVPAKASGTLNITMKPASSDLNEVVIVGYGNQKKVNLTGAVGTISGKVLEDRPLSTIGRGLQGQLPGLNITSDNGQPGRGAAFNIRGFTSINGGSPLILVDGITTDINNINPDDVASATVLKDAAAAAVYGSRAAFGVILITTKTGQAGKPKVSYNSNYSIRKIANQPDVVADPATVVDYKNRGYAGYYGINKFDSFIIDYAKQRSQNPNLPAAVIDPANPSVYSYVGATNWLKELYKSNNFSQTQNLSVSGGGDRITYYFSADYNGQDGVFRYNPDYYKRINVRSKLDFKVTDWLHVYTNTSYNRTVYNEPSLWTSDWTSGDLYHSIGRSNSLDILKNPDGSYTESGVYLGYLQSGPRANTVTNQPQNTVGFTTSFFNDAWRIKGDYTFRSTNNYYQRSRVALPYETGPDQTISYAGHSDASAHADDNSYQAINLYTEYEKIFGKHYFKGMIGYNQEVNKYNYFSAQNNDLISSNVGYLDATTGATPSVGGNGYQWAVRGIFSRLNYIYNNKYLLEVDARYDGSSRFPPSDHYGFFPSASAGWRVSEEPFFKSLNHVVTNFKFRASYGSLGNDQSLGNYDFIPKLPTSQIDPILGGIQPIAVYPATLVASNLTWEKVNSKDAGVDLTLFGKFDATFDWYQRDTKNMITPGFQLPAVLGAAQPKEKTADLRTQGWELNITYHDQFQLAGKPFNYSIRGSLWDAQTVITRYNNPDKYWFGGGYYVGQHVGDIMGLTTLGIFQSDAAAQGKPDQSKVQGHYAWNKAGELQYADLNHDGKIDYGNGTIGDPGDAHVIGNTTPRYNFGIGGNFSWNNFDFSIFFQGVGKQSFWPGTSSYYWSTLSTPYENVYKNIVDNTWTPQNPDALFPSLKSYRAGDAGAWKDLAVPQSRYIYSAAYIRLKNLSVGYSFNLPALHKIGIERLRIYFSGEDLWESTKLPSGFDPEGLNHVSGSSVGSFGAGKIYPFQRGYSVGLNVKF